MPGGRVREHAVPGRAPCEAPSGGRSEHHREPGRPVRELPPGHPRAGRARPGRRRRDPLAPAPAPTATCGRRRCARRSGRRLPGYPGPPPAPECTRVTRVTAPPECTRVAAPPGYTRVPHAPEVHRVQLAPGMYRGLAPCCLRPAAAAPRMTRQPGRQRAEGMDFGEHPAPCRVRPEAVVPRPSAEDGPGATPSSGNGRSRPANDEATWSAAGRAAQPRGGPRAGQSEPIERSGGSFRRALPRNRGAERPPERGRDRAHAEESRGGTAARERPAPRRDRG